jgi:hypothetical protein
LWVFVFAWCASRIVLLFLVDAMRGMPKAA